MQPHHGVTMFRIRFLQSKHAFYRRAIDIGQKELRDARSDGLIDESIAIRIEFLGIQMRVRIDKFHTCKSMDLQEGGVNPYF